VTQPPAHGDDPPRGSQQGTAPAEDAVHAPAHHGEVPEGTPEHLQRRIDAMRQAQNPADSDSPSLAYALGLFMTLGLSFVGTLVTAVLIGVWLAKRTGQEYWVIIMLGIGLVSAVGVAWRMLQPLLKGK